MFSIQVARKLDSPRNINTRVNSSTFTILYKCRSLKFLIETENLKNRVKAE